MIRVSNIPIPLDYSEATLVRAASAKLRCAVKRVRLAKKSVDARDKGGVHFVVALDVEVAGSEAETLSRFRANPQVVKVEQIAPAPRPCVNPQKRPLVVGLGPAGLFAALTLAEAGARPLVLERGCAVDERKRRVETFFAGGPLDRRGNVLFGEGGAGAFSDGKLTTGISDARCRSVLRALYEAGAPEEILYAAKPHIGTDRLPGAVKRLRERIIELGGEVRFEHSLAGLIIEDGRVRGARVEGPDGVESVVEAERVILAVGHSARDTFSWLLDGGVPMERKPFSIGARVEHLQRLIDVSQYGAFAGHRALGAADYKLSVKLPGGRSAYTFCMCPGGSVIAAASEAGGVVTNGMSEFARAGENANSALLIGVEPADFGEGDALAGVRFQRMWEERAFAVGGGNYFAPAQTVGDFLRGAPSRGPGDVRPTYLPGVTYASLDDCLPAFATEAMRAALKRMDAQIKGFAAPGALLTGVETRSSSPVRLVRDGNCESALKGLYPCGEGAGYAGGIMSAAVDGMRCAESVIRELTVPLSK